MSVESAGSSCSSNWDVSEEDKCLSVRPLVFSSSVEEQDVQLFTEQYDCENHLFPIQQQGDEEHFFDLSTTESPLSL